MHRLSSGLALGIAGEDLPSARQPVERRAARRLCAHLQMEDRGCHERRRGAPPCRSLSTAYVRPQRSLCRPLSPSTTLSMSSTREKLKRRDTTPRAVSRNSSSNGLHTLRDDNVGGVQGAHALACAISCIHAGASARWSSSRVPRSCVSR